MEGFFLNLSLHLQWSLLLVTCLEVIMDKSSLSTEWIMTWLAGDTALHTTSDGDFVSQSLHCHHGDE